MSHRSQTPRNPSAAWRHHLAACLALVIYAIVAALVPSTQSLAARQGNTHATGPNQLPLNEAQEADRPQPWEILRIVPPEHEGELGTIVFGVGQSFPKQTAIRGPR